MRVSCLCHVHVMHVSYIHACDMKNAHITRTCRYTHVLICTCACRCAFLCMNAARNVHIRLHACAICTPCMFHMYMLEHRCMIVHTLWDINKKTSFRLQNLEYIEFFSFRSMEIRVSLFFLARWRGRFCRKTTGIFVLGK